MPLPKDLLSCCYPRDKVISFFKFRIGGGWGWGWNGFALLLIGEMIPITYN